jgi:hypothetical protein
MRRVLVGLHPRRWRAEYGEGFAALLDDTPLTARVVVDALRFAAVAHRRERPRAFLALGAVAWFFVAESAAMRAGITVNVLWAPTTPLRGAALALLLVPLGHLGRAGRMCSS